MYVYNSLGHSHKNFVCHFKFSVLNAKFSNSPSPADTFYYRTEATLARQGSINYGISDNFAGELLYRLTSVTKVCLICTCWKDLDEYYLKQSTFDKFWVEPEAVRSKKGRFFALFNFENFVTLPTGLTTEPIFMKLFLFER